MEALVFSFVLLSLSSFSQTKEELVGKSGIVFNDKVFE